MRLQRVTPPGDSKLRCAGCGRWYGMRSMVADLDGRPFVDYYCPGCVLKDPERERAWNKMRQKEELDI